MTFKVMLVDDQELIRAGLRTIINAHPRLAVTAEVSDGLAGLRMLRETPVDVVLMDLRMPGVDGVETTRRIRSEHGSRSPRILVLTTFDQDDNVMLALRAGADGFFSKGVGPTELTEGIVRVAEGGRVLSETAVDAVVGHVAEGSPKLVDPEAAAVFKYLTPRELEVVSQVVRGLDNSQIAEKLFLSPFTVKTHVNRAMTKVGARDRAHLVSLAVRAGMTP